MKPIVHGLEAKYQGRMVFTYLDIDDPATQALKTRLGYRVQPHYFLLDGQGHVLRRWLGPVAETDFVKAFESALN
jgi:hypothetical protein